MSKTCEPGCTCKRHQRVITDEHRAKIAAANAARRGESHACPPGCTCGRHKAAYRGGSRKCAPRCTCSKHTATSRQPRRELTKWAACEPGCTCGRHGAAAQERARKMTEERGRAPLTDEHKRKISEGTKAALAARTDEQRAETARKKSEAAKAYWAREDLPKSRRRASSQSFRRSGWTPPTIAPEPSQSATEGDVPTTDQLREERRERLGRDSYRQSAEHVAKRNKKCELGCTCGKHRKLPPEAQERRNVAARAGRERAKARGIYSARNKAQWANKSPEQRAEFSRMQSENRKREWAADPNRIKNPGRFPGRISQQELSLVPYLAALGYAHNDAGLVKVGRKFPDFVDVAGKRLFEYFGDYWHPDRAEEQEIIDYYAKRGWTCTVLWESDLADWLARQEQ